MSCEAFEHLILESDGRPLSGDEQRRLDDHLRVCQECRRFAEDRMKIRAVLQGVLPTIPPPALDARTRGLCLEALRPKPAGIKATLGRAGLPVPVLAALALLTVGTLVWLGISLADVDFSRGLTPAAVTAVLLIAQNALMLFFAPILFRRLRRTGNETIHGQ